MQKIEPGEFRMLTADGPPREVTITRPFEAGTTEVTHALWDEVMESNPSIFERCEISCPVESVTWIKAVEFCNQLSKMSGYKSAYRFKDGQVLWISDSKGYRLPTEAEWEYMASQGDMLNRARSNPTLTYTDEKLMVNPAGSMEPNSWGIMDLEGNVGEWVWDFHGPIQSAPVKNPEPGAGDRAGLPRHQRRQGPRGPPPTSRTDWWASSRPQPLSLPDFRA